MSIALKIGLSACLLGERVRYDGAHKHQPQLIARLASFAALCAICPEVEVGLGVPRERIRLVSAPRRVRLVTEQTREEITERMRAYAAARVATAEVRDLSGYVFKSGSPSCGLKDVKLYAGVSIDAPMVRVGRGLFAAAMRERRPDLPMLEESDAHGGTLERFEADVRNYYRRHF